MDRRRHSHQPVHPNQRRARSHSSSQQKSRKSSKSKHRSKSKSKSSRARSRSQVQPAPPAHRFRPPSQHGNVVQVMAYSQPTYAASPGANYSAPYGQNPGYHVQPGSFGGQSAHYSVPVSNIQYGQAHVEMHQYGEAQPGAVDYGAAGGEGAPSKKKKKKKKKKHHEVAVAQYDADGYLQTDDIHKQLARLAREQKEILRSTHLPRADVDELLEQQFHQQMSLLMQLPREEAEQYHPRVIVRMGTVRVNVEDDNVTEHRAYFCYSMLLLNILFFAATMDKANWEFEDFQTNTMYGPSLDVLEAMGAKRGDLIRDGEWGRWFWPMFLHAGVLHLLMNMLVLMRLGVSMEVAFGWWRVGAIYLTSGVMGTVASAVFVPQQLGVGASGALFGLIGALFGDFIQNHKAMREGKCCYFIQLVISTALGLAIGLVPLLDNFNHIGGWLCGVLAGTVFLAASLKDRHGNRITSWYTSILAIVAFVGLVALFIAGFSVFYKGMDPSGFCGFCEKLSCIDTSFWNCNSCEDPRGRVVFDCCLDTSSDTWTYNCECPDSGARLCDGSGECNVCPE